MELEGAQPQEGTIQLIQDEEYMYRMCSLTRGSLLPLATDASYITICTRLPLCKTTKLKQHLGGYYLVDEYYEENLPTQLLTSDFY